MKPAQGKGGGRGTGKRENDPRPEGFSCLFGQESFQFLVELGNDLEEVVNDAVVGFGENRGFRVLVDGNDNF